MIRKLVHVSVGLNIDGGGAALYGRLLARSLADYCQQRQIAFEVLHLGAPTEIIAPTPTLHFHHNQRALALGLWRRSFDRNTAMIFDHLGPARAVGVLPRWLQPHYAISMLGVEVWNILSWERRNALKGADLRLSISHFTEQRARLMSPWLPEVKVLHLALEERPPSGEVDVALVEQLGEGYILIVGRLTGVERYKGHDQLLTAMPKVLRRVPNARLVIVGQGNDRLRLEQVARDLGIDQQVTFTGFVSEATLERLYAQCGLFVMPSKKEGFGLVFLEAMKASKPAIALRDSSVAEIIVDGKTGILIDDHSQELEDALIKLLNNPTLARQMGAAGFERCQNVFSFKRFSERLSSYLDAWLGSTGEEPFQTVDVARGSKH